MFGSEPLARIVRNDARIEVKVPAAKGKKAYSYFREGGEGEAKKPSGGGKKLALIGGGLALAGLGAAALAMSRKKPSEQVAASPVKVSEPEKKTNNTARNVAIGVGAAGLGAVATKIATAKKDRRLEEEDLQGNSLSPEAENFFRSHPEALKAHEEVNGLFREYMNINQAIRKENRLADDKITEAGSKILSDHPAFASRFEVEKYYVADQYLKDVKKGESKGGGAKEIKKEDTYLYEYLGRELPDEYSLEDVDRLRSDYIMAVEKTDYKKNREKAKSLSNSPKTSRLVENMMEKGQAMNDLLDKLEAPEDVRKFYR